MTLSEVYQAYQDLVEAQSAKPTKKRVTEIRKALLVIKKSCDTERKALLPVKVKVEPIEELPIPEMLPLNREVTVSISSDQPVESVEVKTDKKKRKKPKPL